MKQLALDQLLSLPTTTKVADVSKGMTRFDPPIQIEYAVDPRLKLIDNLPDLQEMLARLVNHSLVAVDTETNGFDYLSDHIIGMSLCFEEESSYYLPFRHKNTYAKQLKWEEAFPLIKEALLRPSIKLVFHNFKFDGHMFREAGFDLTPGKVELKIEDTMLMSHLLAAHEPKSLKHLAKIHLDPNADQWEIAVSKYRGKYSRQFKIKHKDDVTYDYVPVPLMTQYAAADTLYTFQLYQKFAPQIAQNPKFMGLYMQEKHLSAVLMRMEREGAKTDAAYLKRAGKKAEAKLEELRTDIVNLLKQERCFENAQLKAEVLDDLNLDSTPQLGKLFSALGLSTGKKTDTGRMAVDDDVLKKMQDKHPMIKLLRHYKKLKKLHSTYIEGMLAAISPVTGRVHPNFQAAGTETGRLSCAAPNLQNMPRPGEDEFKTNSIIDVRKAFIPPSKDYIMVFIDLSQIELRLTAHYSADPILLDSYAKNEDLHIRGYVEMYNVKKESVTKEQRNRAKTMNFATLYGSGPKRLAQATGQTLAQCKDYQERFFSVYRGVKQFIDQSHYQIKTEHYAETMYGRKRSFPEIPKLDPNNDWWLIEEFCRSGTNFIIQGTGADMLKTAMCKIDQYLIRGNYKTKMVLTIHDELIFYLHKEELDLIPKLKGIMEAFNNFLVPILSEVSYSEKNWAEKKSLEMKDLETLKQQLTTTKEPDHASISKQSPLEGRADPAASSTEHFSPT